MTAPSVQILLFPGFDELDGVAPFEVLGAAGFAVRMVGVDGAGTLEAHHGLRVGVDGPVTAGAGDLLLVPGGGWVSERGGVRRAVEEGVIPELIGAAHAAGATVVSVCTGAILLGAAGLLDGRPATTHAAGVDALAGFGAHVRRDVRVVDDVDIVTCGGVTAALDLSLHLVARFLGDEAAARGATRLEYDWRPEVVAA